MNKEIMFAMFSLVLETLSLPAMADVTLSRTTRIRRSTGGTSTGEVADCPLIEQVTSPPLR